VIQKGGRERRKLARMALKIPTRVQGRDADGTAWEELATTADASAGGLALILQRAVRIGQCLHLTLPLPKRYRQYDLPDQTYRVYTLVRSTFGSIPPYRVGVLFLGKFPPRGASDPIPSEVFLLPGDEKPAPERRAFPRHEVRLCVTLERPLNPGAPLRSEETVAENLSKWGALVKTALPVAKGEMVSVAECGNRYKSRAEIRNVTIGADGSVKLNLLFLDGPVPDELLPPAPTEEPASKP
jgi:hypothetical protein